MLRKGENIKNKDKKVQFKEVDVKEKGSPGMYDLIENKNTTRSKSTGKSLMSQSKELDNKISPQTLTSVLSTTRLSTVSVQRKTTINDFELITELGKGSYAKVMLGKHKETETKYALKINYKSKMNRFGLQHEVHIEKNCLVSLTHPNIIKLEKCFQDKEHLYFVLEYCRNKDLGKLMKLLGTLDFQLAQYYAGEIISALSYMHSKGIYHRDVKPENIGIDEDMHLKLLDFGTADFYKKYFDKKTMKFINLDMNRKEMEEYIVNNGLEDEDCILIDQFKIILLSHQFVGTEEYVSPEMLEHNYEIIGPGIDIWAFGIILYLFFSGKTPFKGKNEEETFDNIKNVRYRFNDKMPEEAKDLISKILVKDPSKRLGYNSKDYKEIKEHPFFKGINFDILEDEPIPLEKVSSTLENYGYIIPRIKGYEYNDEEDILNKSDNHILYENINSLTDLENEDLINIKFRMSTNNLEHLTKNIPIEHELLLTNSTKEKDNKDKNIKTKDYVIIEDVLQKKSPWFHYNSRLVKLYSKGHIDYLEPSTNEIRGSIIINESCKCTYKDNDKIEISTPSRRYIFKIKDKKKLKNWHDEINSFITKFSNIIQEKININK